MKKTTLLEKIQKIILENKKYKKKLEKDNGQA